MDLSVVVPTLNGRDQLAASLDALAAHASDAEVIVVNGPSADGTTGMVRERDDVDVLVELSDRRVNVARNAGIEEATGDVVAFVDYDLVVESGWLDAVSDGLGEADVVTGPTHQSLRVGKTAEDPEHRTIGDRSVTYFNGGNVAFRTSVLTAIDGFDEFLHVGGARDAAHRLAGVGQEIRWQSGMSARREYEADGGVKARNWNWKYRALTYRLVKNYGVRPTVARRTLGHCTGDAVEAAKAVVKGESALSAAVGVGRDVVTGAVWGVGAGLKARAKDRTPTRNPHGLSRRSDRAVTRYDWR